MRIGVFDSGIGGLSVLKALYEAQLFDEIIYFGDTARVPYGVKDSKTIIKFSLEALDFFSRFELDLLIVACNTASAHALKEMKKRANFSVYGVIDAGVDATKNAILDKKSEILVIATKATINSNEYQHRLKNEGFVNVKALATGLFVPMVEEGIFDGEFLNSAFNHYFHSLLSSSNSAFSPLKIDALILACTHFPFISKPLQEFFGPKTRLIHSGEAIVEFLKNKENLQKKNTLARLEFHASSDVEALKKTAKIWLNL